MLIAAVYTACIRTIDANVNEVVTMRAELYSHAGGDARAEGRVYASAFAKIVISVPQPM